MAGTEKDGRVREAGGRLHRSRLDAVYDGIIMPCVLPLILPDGLSSRNPCACVSASTPAASLRSGSEGWLEIEPVSTPMTLAKRAGGRVAVPEEKLPPLTDDVVRATIERTRR